MQFFMTKTAVLILLSFSLCSFEAIIRRSVPPQDHTGASGAYCINCHSGNLNESGGGILINGLPDDGYTAGASYSFNININHAAADRKRWGFSIIAKNSAGVTVGSFTSTNANAATNGEELSHFNAVLFPAFSQSYTYTNLTWTAPANPSAADENITFYVAGIAANGNGSNAGDFTYSATKNMSLLVSQTYTFTGNGNWDDAANWSDNTIPPSTITGSAVIVINPQQDGECVLNVEQHISSSANLSVAEGKKFRILGNLIINN
jgi:hypothetical protein